MEEKKNLPTLAELHHLPEQAQKLNHLNRILNHKPKASWLKPHPMAKKRNGQAAEYLSISKVEELLDKLFQQYKIEVISTAQMFNSVAVTIRLHYINPVTGDWQFHDGVGAVGIQTNKGAQASDLNAIKQDAVMKALPSAKSYAIKDAAHHIGRIFGRDTNRDPEEEVRAVYTSADEMKHEEKTRILFWLGSGKVSESQLIDFLKSDVYSKWCNDADIVQAITNTQELLNL